MESDIVFRIAIVHATDLETAIDAAKRYSRGKYGLANDKGKGGREGKGTRMAGKTPKVFKRLQTINSL